MKTRLLGYFSLFLIISLTAACGGSGSDNRSGVVDIIAAFRCAIADVNGSPNCVSEKIEGDSFETDQNAIHLAGLSFEAEDDGCPEPTIFGPPCTSMGPAHYEVTWINLTNGASWDASIEWANLFYSTVAWRSYDSAGVTLGFSDPKGIPLEKGPNTIRITATDSGFSREAEITITRVVDVTPPTVHSVALSFWGLEVFFTEQLDPASVVTSISVVDNNNQSIPGTIEFDPKRLRVVWDPESSLNENITYTAQISGVTDWAPNVMIDPYEWSFKGRPYGPEPAVF